jgi:hypothetical protein
MDHDGACQQTNQIPYDGAFGHVIKCPLDAITQSERPTARSAASVVGVSIAVFAAGCLLAFTSWLSGPARTARTTDWDWFVAVLALGPVGALAYGLRRAE